MKEVEQEKIYFVPGNIVTLKHDLPNKPTMLVTEVVTSKILPYGYSTWESNVSSSIVHTQTPQPSFKGIRCVWFTENKELQEKIFSTKDLQKI